MEQLIRSADVLGLGAAGLGPWSVASELYAVGQLSKPAIVLSDGDLLIAATATHHGRTLVTADMNLARSLAAIGWGLAVDLLERAVGTSQ